MDPESGLLQGGDEHTQLTWMDAKRDGVVMTPRHGRPVEVNALWYHGSVPIRGPEIPCSTAFGLATKPEAINRLQGRVPVKELGWSRTAISSRAALAGGSDSECTLGFAYSVRLRA